MSLRSKERREVMEITSRKMGRKTKYDNPVLVSKVIHLYAESDLSTKEIAKACDISTATLYRIINQEKQSRGLANG